MSSPSPSVQPSRRVPPPCWTHEETLALIDSYYEKYHSLNRGNLKASHWKEVADSVAHRCTSLSTTTTTSPSKTSVQCRHKIEKLRKRYRTERQRATLAAPNRFSSSWILFRKIDALEKGPSSSPAVDSDDNVHDDDGDEDNDEDDLHRLIINGGDGGGGGGFRFRIPSGVRSVPTVKGFVKSKNYENPNFNSNPNPRFLNSCSRSGFRRSDGGGGKREMDPIVDVVSAIRMLGEGFVKMEQMKIEMTREMEQIRMEMEMKRTEMILESQQRIVDAFAKGFSSKKKLKRMPSSSPDC